MSLQSVCDEKLLKKEGKQMKSLSQRRKTNGNSIPFLTREKSLMSSNNSESANNLDISNAINRDLDENKLFDENIDNDDL